MDLSMNGHQIGGDGGGKGSVRAAVLQEKEALKKNGQCMSQ